MDLAMVVAATAAAGEVVKLVALLVAASVAVQAEERAPADRGLVEAAGREEENADGEAAIETAQMGLSTTPSVHNAQAQADAKVRTHTHTQARTRRPVREQSI